MKTLAAALRACAWLLVGAGVLAQEDLHPRLRPITAPVRHAGVFHVATGTWTREASLANLTGPDTIYNNTCSANYFASQVQGEKWQHRSRVPSPSGPTTPSVFYGLSSGRNDEAPGCRTSYAINGFEVAYCSSSATGNHSYLYEFADFYNSCGLADMVPTYSVTVTGLPGGTPSGGQRCWVVDIDLGSAPPFVLQADGDGTYVGPSTQEQFGYSLGPVTPQTSSDACGPLIAGNYTSTGGAMTPCTGTDGTIWDSPVNLAEPGTGMASNSFFRATGSNPNPSGPGCYFFHNDHLDFYLKLFSDTRCPPASVMEPFCFPGQDGVIACPCGNPPTVVGRGCDNFGAGPEHSCVISGSGTASVSSDTLVLTSSGENNTSLTVFLQGPSSSATGFVFGAGVRCVVGSLKRLYSGAASGGSISRPGAGDLSVSARSAQLGDTLSAGSTRYYMTHYRDSNAAGPCGDPVKTFNSSQAGRVTWQP